MDQGDRRILAAAAGLFAAATTAVVAMLGAFVVFVTIAEQWGPLVPVLTLLLTGATCSVAIRCLRAARRYSAGPGRGGQLAGLVAATYLLALVWGTALGGAPAAMQVIYTPFALLGVGAVLVLRRVSRRLAR